MPTKRKWWSENWQSTISMAVMLVFTMGAVATQLQFKVDRYEVQVIVEKETKDHSFPLVEGVRLQSEYTYIKENLEYLREELRTIKEKIFMIAKNVELSQRSRTTANKKIGLNMPTMVINPWPDPGIQDTTPIGKLEDYRLPK